MTDEHPRRGLPRLLVLAALLLACVGLEYWAHIRYGLTKVYPHLFYAPVLLAAVWWGLKGGLLVALFVSSLHVAAYLPGIDEAALSRAVVFVCMGFAAGILSRSRKHAAERLEHLNRVLRAIRNVSQLVTRESDRDTLVKAVCDTLVVTSGYHNAWIALLDEAGMATSTAEAGLGEAFLPLAQRLKSGALTYCARRAVGQSGVVATEAPCSACADCPLAASYHGRSALAARLECRGRVYGVLSASVPAQSAADDEELALFAEVAADVALALHNMQSEEERQRAEAALRKAHDELEERVERRTAELAALNKELASFSHSVSHDLRAPLRALEGFGKALIDDCAGALDEQGKHYVDRIRAGCHRMSELIEDLLRLSGVTAAEMSYETVDLSEMAREVAAELRKGEPERNVEFIIPDGLVVEGDRRLLRILVEHLLGNAWKFTSRHPTARIELGATAGEEGQVFFVRDDGAGFDTQYAHKLFAPFQRLHSQEEFPGTGIGLATAQRIVRRHGGRVWFEAAVEQGATFYFTL